MIRFLLITLGSLIGAFLLIAIAESSFGQQITIGETNILSDTDEGNSNLLLAQSATLSQSATISSMSFYVRTVGGNLRLGIYDSSGPNGGAGKLLTQSSDFVVTSTGWVTLAVQPVVLPPGSYWLAYLPNSDALGFWVDRTSGKALYYSLPYGQMPSTFSASPNTVQCHWSMYATLTPTINSVTLSWSAPPQVSGYKLLYGSTKGGPYTNVIDVGLVNTYKLTGLASGTYYFVTEYYDASGTTYCFSNEVSFTVK